MVSPREREVRGLVSIREAAQYQLPRNHGQSDWHRSQRQKSCAVLSGEGGGWMGEGAPGKGSQGQRPGGGNRPGV